MLGSYEGITLNLSYVKFLGTLLVDVDGITLGIDCGTEMGSLDGILVVLMMEILKTYFLEAHWYIY